MKTCACGRKFQSKQGLAVHRAFCRTAAPQVITYPPDVQRNTEVKEAYFIVLNDLSLETDLELFKLLAQKMKRDII